MTIQYQGVWSLQSAAQLQSTQRWVTDPLFENTTLLLQADDAANGAQNNTFLDSSSNAFAITRNGGNPGMTQGTFTPFSLQPGAWSNFFDGTGDYLSNTSTALITNTVSTFTVESWVYFTATPPANGNFISSFCTLDGQPTGPTNFMSFGPLNDGKLYLFWFDGSVKYASGNTVLALNTWYHIACVVNSNSIQFYVNGIPEVMGNTTTLTNRSGSQGNFAVASSSGGQITGYISNFRVTTTAVYTSRFTPSTTPLTPVTGTVLLTCQSNQFIDTNTQVAAKALTVNGNSAVQAFSPFAPQYQWTSSVIGGSGFFDGTTDTLTAANNAAFQFGTGDFEVSGWVYPTSYASVRGFFGNGGQSNGTLFAYLTTAGKFESWIYGDATQTPTINIPLNAWTYLTVSRVGTTFRTFVNGVQDISYNTSRDISAQGCIVGDAFTNGGFLFQGYISSVRVRKGSGVSSVTVPTAPSTAITNTQLLLNFTNAGIYDGTMKNNLETVGNAQVSTAVVKYGSGSMYFDGTGDYLRTLNSQNISFGTGDFTIEIWLWFNATPTGDVVVMEARPSNTAVPWIITADATSGGTLYFYDGTTYRSTIPITPQTWMHFAVSRVNGTLRIFNNGVQGFSGTVTTSLNPTGALIIGARNDGLVPFTGYMDDIRITKGIGRYTQNFIPPSVALPRQ